MQKGAENTVEVMEGQGGQQESGTLWWQNGRKLDTSISLTFSSLQWFREVS